MSSAIIQLLVLAAIAIFLILRLRNVLGTRDGFERPRLPDETAQRRNFDVIDGTLAQNGDEDQDITDHAQQGSPAAEALAQMKRVEPNFSVTEFLAGAKGAYEMIIVAFERGDLSGVRPFLSDDVAEAFENVIADRHDKGLNVTVTYLGTRETALAGAEFDENTGEAEISVRLVGEMILAIHDAQGNLVEGDPKSARKQRDVWTFGRAMGQDDPNWQLIATG